MKESILDVIKLYKQKSSPNINNSKLDFQNFEKYISLNEYDDFINYETLAGGLPDNIVKTILNIIYKSPYVRTFTRGELDKLYNKNKKILLGNIIDLNTFKIYNKKEIEIDINNITSIDIENNIKKKEYIPLYYKTTNKDFIKQRPVKYFNKNAKPVFILFEINNNTNFYIETNYVKTNEQNNILKNNAVSILIKGSNIMMTNTSDIIGIDSIYKIKNDIKDTDKDVLIKIDKDHLKLDYPFNPKTNTEIDKILKNINELVTGFESK